jgi:hypothetical protein
VRFVQLDGLTDRQTRPGLIAKPGNQRDVPVGIESLISAGPSRRWNAVTSFPGAKRVRRDSRAQDHCTSIVNWPCCESAEEFHAAHSFNLDYTDFAVTGSVTCATMDTDSGHDYVRSYEFHLPFDWGV